MPPSGSAPTGGVHVGEDCHSEVSSRPLWASGPVATWNWYCTPSPSGSPTAPAVKVGVVEVTTAWSAGADLAGTGGAEFWVWNDHT